MGTVVLQPQPYGRMVRTLREFEGWRTLWWRLPLAALAFIGVPLFAIGAGVLAAAIGAGKFGLGKAVVAAIVATVAAAYIQPRLARRQVHRKLIAARLWTWEKPNPATYVQILLGEADMAEARRVLRRSGFNPSDFATHLGVSVPDAPDLDFRVGVEEPEAHPQSSSDEDRVRRMVRALDVAGIRARVAGVDVPARSTA